MNDEIKEILRNCEKIINEASGYNDTTDKIIDYITNLQEENERLKNGYCELKVKCNNGECDCTNEEYDSMVQANMRCSLLLEDYKSKNEKAILFIDNYLKIIDNPDINMQIVKDILKGNDNND